MTEAEWTSATSCQLPIQFLDEQFGDRKRRLFACACCRRSWHWIEGTDAGRAVEVAEAFADGGATWEELGNANSAARLAASSWYREHRQTQSVPKLIAYMHASACAQAASSSGTRSSFYNYAIAVTHYAAQAYAYEAINATEPRDSVWRHAAAEDAAQLHLLRDIFGNPFRPVEFQPEWRTTDVMLLARGIYDEKAFDRMPILADALQDAGCTNEDILTHLRDPELLPRNRPAKASGPAPVMHVRGCWALDLIFGTK